LYTEMDPAASSKMQFAQDIMSKNPKAQQALQSDRIFQILFENYTKQLQFSIDQEKNKQIGRIGVSPASEEIQKEMGEAQPQQQAAPPPQQNQNTTINLNAPIA